MMHYVFDVMVNNNEIIVTVLPERNWYMPAVLSANSRISFPRTVGAGWKRMAIESEIVSAMRAVIRRLADGGYLGD